MVDSAEDPDDEPDDEEPDPLSLVSGTKNMPFGMASLRDDIGSDGTPKATGGRKEFPCTLTSSKCPFPFVNATGVAGGVGWGVGLTMTSRGYKDVLGEPTRLADNGVEGAVPDRDGGAVLERDEGAVVAREATEVSPLAMEPPKIGSAGGGTTSTAIDDIDSFSASGVGNDDARSSCRDSAIIGGA